jgi:DNA-binding NtrC family response regulator
MSMNLLDEIAPGFADTYPRGENLTASREKSSSGRVLVVDDEPLLRWSVGETLRETGFEVTEASDAASAMDALHHDAAIDVVLLDLVLPDSDDLRVLSAMHRELPDTPVILMTAHGSPELFRTATRLGAFAVLDKPFEMDEVARLAEQAADHPGLT